MQLIIFQLFSLLKDEDIWRQIYILYQIYVLYDYYPSFFTSEILLTLLTIKLIREAARLIFSGSKICSQASIV